MDELFNAFEDDDSAFDEQDWQLLFADAIDAADVVAILVQRRFPELSLTRTKTAYPWRICWQIEVPPQTDYSLTEVDQFVHDLTMRMFWEKGTLVAYAITREPPAT